MSARFVVRPDGSIETDSYEYALMFQRDAATRRAVSRQPASAPSSAALRPSDAREFLRQINGNQGKILRTLLDNPEGLRDTELCVLVEAEDNHSLAGMMSHIRPQAAKFGLGDCEIYESLPSEVSGSLRYRLTEQFRQACQQREPEQRPKSRG